MNRDPVAINPFYVLELPTDCTAAEVERAGQKLLVMLEVGLEAADHYPTPLGGMPRDADLVRRSLDELRNPDRRLLHEVWASLAGDGEGDLDRDPPAEPSRMPGALAAFGWGPR